MTDTQGQLEFAPDRSTAGFRLHALSVLNWGTFHGRVHTVAPEGRTALLSGANASGKSTLADAILTLLIDGRRRNYNQASGAGSKKERSEKAYILGAYSEKHDEDYGRSRPQHLRRPGESVTVLLAHFYNENFNTHVSLAQVLWINSGGRIERAFLVERRALTIEGDFADLGGPTEVRARLRDRGLDPLDTFTAYSQRFHEWLCLSRSKSPMEIFNQAICIKDISNLTQFIREYMLDDGGAAEKLDNLRRNFEELRLTYQRIKTDKERLEALDEIHRLHESISRHQDEATLWTRRIESIPLFFADLEHGLRSEEQERLLTSHAMARADREVARQDLQRFQERVADLKRQIEGSEAGRRLQEIERDSAALEKIREDRRQRRRRFDSVAARWAPAPALDGSPAFERMKQECEREMPKLRNEMEGKGAEVSELKRQIDDNQRDQERFNGEIRHLQDRRSNISREHIQRRDRIAEAIGVNPDRLPYVGELVRVREADEAWTGAIERLAHQFGLSILVPESLRAEVDHFVHRENQRGLVVYHIVGKPSGTVNPRLSVDSVAAKLEIHPEAGGFGPWLEWELSYRFPHRCFETPGDAFHQAEAALTMAGLIRQKGGERRKDDRRALGDRRDYVLGWDNASKIEALREALKQCRSAASDLNIAIGQAQKARAALGERVKAGDSLFEVASSWEEIDWESIAVRLEELRLEAELLRKGSEVLNKLREQQKEAESKEKEADSHQEAATKRQGAVEERQAINDNLLSQCAAILAAADAAATEDFDPRAYHRDLNARLAFPVKAIDQISGAREGLEHELGRERSSIHRQSDSDVQQIKLTMQRLLDRLQIEDARLHDELVAEDLSRHGYSNALYEPYGKLRARIVEDDLPKNEQRFEALLQNNVVEEVANFDALLQNHATSIQRRIADLNDHLRQIDYDRREETFIQLAPTRNHDEHQRRFATLRQYALTGSTRFESTAEERREAYQRVEHFLRELEHDEVWTQRVIDVRNWFDFRADEFFRASGELRQSYAGASGKSGGEKNRLASTILATAIAFQYGISVNERQSDTFRLVVVDEMFSKTDDEFSTYLLELFREFHLQLIVIQPLDSKIHLVQKYVERYHIVTRSGDLSSVRNLSVHEYIEALAGAQEV